MARQDQNQSQPTVPCAEFGELIFDLQHDRLSDDARFGVETHLASCSACRRLARELESVDAIFVSKFSSKSLPASFKTALFARIDVADVGATQPEFIATRKKEVEDEFRLESNRLLPRVVRQNWERYLDWAGVLALLLIGILLWQKLIAPNLDLSALWSSALASSPTIYGLWAAGIAAVAGAFGFGLRRTGAR